MFLSSDPVDEKKSTNVTGYIIGEDKDCPDGSELLGKYVAVLYDGKPYTGLVADYDEQDIQMSCMNRIGHAKHKPLLYYWPTIMSDICWHPFAKIVAVIPKPKINGRHFELEESIWNRVQSYSEC